MSLRFIVSSLSIVVCMKNPRPLPACWCHYTALDAFAQAGMSLGRGGVVGESPPELRRGFSVLSACDFKFFLPNAFKSVLRESTRKRSIVGINMVQSLHVGNRIEPTEWPGRRERGLDERDYFWGFPPTLRYSVSHSLSIFLASFPVSPSSRHMYYVVEYMNRLVSTLPYRASRNRQAPFTNLPWSGAYNRGLRGG
jgi:hypothetical protein